MSESQSLIANVRVGFTQKGHSRVDFAHANFATAALFV
jgi:hypothetical protein